MSAKEARKAGEREREKERGEKKKEEAMATQQQSESSKRKDRSFMSPRGVVLPLCMPHAMHQRQRHVRGHAVAQV